MSYPRDQIDALKPYCASVKALVENQIAFLLLEGLRLPAGCQPGVCDALLCPVPREGYPSRLYLSVQVQSAYTRNWNCTNARIGERNWFAFSWKVELANPTLVQILIGHLNGFAKEK